MNDFQLQRVLRDLRTAHMPRADLWPDITERIAGAAAKPARSRQPWPWFAAAAAIALALGAGVFSLALHGQRDARGDLFADFDSQPSVRDQIERARALAANGDPRLAGAEVVIDVASEELEQALQQQPDAVFLVGLINRTHAQRRKLARLGISAG